MAEINAHCCFFFLFTRPSSPLFDGSNEHVLNLIKIIHTSLRSCAMYESVTLQMHWRTPQSKIDTLDRSLTNWIAAKQNLWFVPSTTVMFQSTNFQQYLEVTIGIGRSGT
ncbi:hypothetical protein BDP27DRAFT_261259 [Rhodocollybia butyracea]|uniref:Uncharacterized protein n=1 Tax=Rhodocollybia butyracea TaxID=206335 RepID=A0A9P5Q273_9AGAR|nr:hypothetical protein BDP27DRAFT_261259 [Rhodocollybia butyracea]